MNEKLETTAHKQLLPDTAVDLTRWSHICQLNLDIAKLHQKQKSQNRNLGIKRMSCKWSLISYPEKGVGKEQKRNFINTTQATQIKLLAHYIRANLYSNDLLNCILPVRPIGPTVQQCKWGLETKTNTSLMIWSQTPFSLQKNILGSISHLTSWLTEESWIQVCMLFSFFQRLDLNQVLLCLQISHCIEILI